VRTVTSSSQLSVLFTETAMGIQINAQDGGEHSEYVDAVTKLVCPVY
jgi:hypothetical protein